VLWKNDTLTGTPWLLYTDPETGGGEPGMAPQGWLYASSVMEDVFPFAADHLATHFGFTILINEPYKGTIYIDDVRLE
jgi:hypothetical protein